MFPSRESAPLVGTHEPDVGGGGAISFQLVIAVLSEVVDRGRQSLGGESVRYRQHLGAPGTRGEAPRDGSRRSAAGDDVLEVGVR
jgi:hypothetical protein